VSLTDIRTETRVESFRASGGDQLHYRVVEAGRPDHALIYLHGIESHGEWFLPAASRLRELGVTTILLDRRGSGLNSHLEPGHADSAAELLEDVRLLRAKLGPQRFALVGLSWGGKLALAAALAQPDSWTRLILITPGLVPRVDLAWSEKFRLLACWAFRPHARFGVPIEPEMFTQTPHWLDYLRQDPMRLKRVTAKFLRASVSLDSYVRSRIEKLRVPSLLLLAGDDSIIDNDKTRRLFERIRPDLRTVEVFAGATHSLQFDCVDRLVEHMKAFLENS
jgi:pimeloyl-ACP methyl ester carboxylesterase